MTRIFLAIATAVFATTSLFTPAAEACISCNYTPEVVNTPNPNAKRHQQKRSQAVKKQRAPAAAKSQAARKGQPAKAAQQTKAKAAPATGVTETAPEKNEVAKAEPEAEATETGQRLTGSSALMQQSIRKEEKPVEAADAEGACKKFIPAVGTTVSVPCE